MPPSFGRAVLSRMKRAIVQGMRDCGQEIYRQAVSNAPVGEQVDRGGWRTGRSGGREWGFRKSVRLNASGSYRQIPNGVQVLFTAPHAARLEFGMDDHYEEVDEYFRRVRRTPTTARQTRTPRRRRRVVAYTSVRAYRRFVPESGGRRFLGDAVDTGLSKLDIYVGNALQQEFS